MIIYEGLGHTPVWTLFKAQIYLNKNKNKNMVLAAGTPLRVARGLAAPLLHKLSIEMT